MTRVNYKPIQDGLRSKAWQRLWNVVKRSGSSKALAEDLKKFLTPSEIAMLEKRLAIPVLLAQGFSYRKICRAIEVSQPTVSFVKHNLTRKPRKHREYSKFSKPRYPKTTPFHSRSGRDRWNWLNQLGN